MPRVFDPHTPELMDRVQSVTPEFEVEMRDLAEINRLFGSHRLVRKFLARWFRPGGSYRVLDFCTGGGDVVRAMVDWARTVGVTLRIDAVDASEPVLQLARRASAAYPEISYHRAKALTFEPGETYDLVTCTLALHHFTDEDAAMLLRRCARFSHRWTLATDLERSPATTLGVQLLTTFIYRGRMTRYDGLLSARHAFSFREYRALADAAGWRDFGHARFAICRQAVWRDERTVGDIPVPVTDALPCPT